MKIQLFLVFVLFSAFVLAEEEKEKDYDLSRDEIRKYAQEEQNEENAKKRKTVEEGVTVYGHLHHSLAKEERAQKARRKSLLTFDLAQERADALKNNESVDADIVAIEIAYEKIFTQLLKEIGMKEARKLSPRALLFEIEKRMEEKEKAKRVKPSERMLAYLKNSIMQTSKFNAEGEESKYDLKKFVSNVFGKYRARHEEDKERSERIIKLEKHIHKDKDVFGERYHNEKERREEFHDSFYTPEEFRSKFKQPYLKFQE